MKNKLLILLLIIPILLTGCESTKHLTCTVEESLDGRTTKSELNVYIKEEKVRDMRLTMNISIPEGQDQYKQAMINQIRQKTNQVYSTNEGIRAIFGMDSEYFNTLGLSQNVSYNDLKQVLEIQGYTCK